ncbi:MAG: GGDEF domain-containing protein [Gammaproteobacteria bacterium]|nr:GGDEF domain-containing protein [Gammaproteobacteria bacterium]
MSADALIQLFILTAEAVAVGLLLLGFFSLRDSFGYAPIYITIGSFQFLQTLFAATLYLEIYPGIFVSPGSAVLFTATLFTVLLVYIRDDAAQARALIAGIIAANITVSLIIEFASLQIGSNLLVASGNANDYLLQWNLQAFVIGTAVLMLDAFLIIVSYEFFFRVFKRLLIARIVAAMLFVVSLDTVLFVSASFWGNELFFGIMLSGILGKAVMTLVYSILLTGYLLLTRKLAVNGAAVKEEAHSLFHILTYKQRFELLEEEVKRDGLTGLFNRRFFDANLKNELDRAQRLSHSLNLVLIDIDHFKQVNDIHGHQTGDEVIIALADSMQSAFRKAEIPCRYGGEEFTVIMPDSEIPAASKAIERLQRDFQALCLERNLPDAQQITFTAGIANYPKDADTVEALIACADRRLYKGKNRGRDQVMYDTVMMKSLKIR